MDKPINYYITEEKDKLINLLQQAVNTSALPPSIIAIILDSAVNSYKLSVSNIANKERQKFETEKNKEIIEESEA